MGRTRVTVTKAIAIVGAVALAAILLVSLSTRAPKASTRGPVPVNAASLSTGRPAVYEFSTDS
jgi:hypothetical protein